MKTAMTSRQEDALREVCHLGSAQAASMLARLVGDVGVLVDVPIVLAANRWQVGWLLGGRDLRVLAATFQVSSDDDAVRGELWWVLSADAAERLGRRLLSRPGVSGPLSTSVGAALTEAANIVASACLTSIGTMVHARLLPTTPDVRELTVAGLVGQPEVGEVRTVLGASFMSTNAPSFGGWLVLLFDEPAREALLRRLGL
jgi:chemotaxis protein CheC